MTEPQATTEPGVVETREVTLEEAMAMAILFQKHGQLADAESLYREVLKAVPDHPDALHFSGVLAHQQGRSDEAIALIERSLAQAPDQPDCYSNLGIIFKARGRIDEAIAAYQRAIALNPAHANAHNNLGVLLKAQGRKEEAEAEYREAIRLNPQHVDAYNNLGVLLSNLKRLPEAVECFCRVTTLMPKHPEARRLLAMAHCTLGETEKAVKIFEEWLAEEPESPIARHMLAACSGRSVPERASDAFVEQVFDGFAASFDKKLAQLSYRAPAICHAMLEDAGFEAAKQLDILDAGCGTGLCGPLITPYARRLVGVDLSAGMLTEAKDKGVYDELAKGELTEYLRAHRDAFDLVVSADTLVYFGNLDEVMTAAAAALRPGGHMIFTLEEAGAGEGALDFVLRTHGRYCHTQRYVEAALARAGLVPLVVHAELRMEAGSPVAGLAVRATKRDGAHHA
jgi:predicted TPR repeat methyltransferase